MNVYVRELATSLAQAGVAVRVYTRATHGVPAGPQTVEPNLVVVPIAAGDPDLSKEDLGSAIEEFTAGVALDLAATGGTDAIHANYWLSAVAGQTLAHALRVPLAVSFHTLARVKLAHGDPEPGGRAAAEERAVASADVLCAASASDASDLSTHYGADPRRIVRVPPGVQHAFFSPGSRAGARRALGLGDAPHVLFVGRIQPLKGLDVAVCAMAELQRSDARLLAVGGPSGPHGAAEQARVNNLIAAAGLGDRVTITDPQPHHILSTYYRAADVVVVPSRTEAFGIVVLEAWRRGTPVVASDRAGLGELVRDGVDGLLVDPEDIAALAGAIVRVLGDAALAEALAGAGCTRVGSFTWEAVARDYADVYAAALSSVGRLT